MIIRNAKHDTVAYDGKHITYIDTDYKLAKEQQLGSCIGCSFKGKSECPIDVSKFCNQGIYLRK